MDTAGNLLTVGDYYAITVEGDRRELVEGAIVVNAPIYRHERVRARMIGALYAWTGEDPARGIVLPTTDVRLDEHNLFNPDVLWIAAQPSPADLYGYPDRVPDICVEVRSPSTWRRDTTQKRAAYERGGCPELWLVDYLERRVLVYRRSQPDAAGFDVELVVADELASPQLPGFALPLERLFRDL